MIFLVVGDLHIKSDNFDEIDIVLSDMKKICEEEKIDRIVLLGDILHYHERIFVQPLNKAQRFIGACTRIAFTYILVGNHDMENNQQFLTSAHWMNAMKMWQNIKIVDKVVEEEKFLLCPYVFPGRFIEALNTGNMMWKDKKLIFAHQEFKGCKMGAIVSENGDEWSEEFPSVISGHIHDTQKIYSGKVYYPGAPLQHTFGDVDKRIVCTVELGDNDLKIKEHDLNVPKKHIIHSDIKNLKNVKDTKGDKVKIKLSATPEEFKLFKGTSEYKEMIQNGIKIHHIPDMIFYEEDKKNTLAELNFLKVLNDLVEKDDKEVQELYKQIFG
jgi:DNA repair exonuclease SbcCD nuclease subunit